MGACCLAALGRPKLLSGVLDNPGVSATIPTSYPVEWERAAVTRDGVAYRIRPIHPADGERERAFILSLSPESRYSRVMHTVGVPSAEVLARMVSVDYRRSMAFVAVVAVDGDERILGVARYAADGEDQCEFAVAVLDDWQRRGVGAALLRLLCEYARAQGVRTLHGRILSSNHRMIELVRWCGMTVRCAPNDSTMTEAALTL